MKKIIYISLILSILVISCKTGEKISKSTAYGGFYKDKPVVVLLMPPINKSTNVEAKEYFHSTLNIPIDNAGYYVIPPFLSMEILKKESAFDSELFIDGSLAKFGEVFGADLALFTIITKWDKSAIASNVYVEVEYILKSIKTNEVIYTRKGQVTYDASVDTGMGGIGGLVANLAASAINTAATKYVDVARACNAYTFKDMPAGKYHPSFMKDSTQLAGPKSYKVTLNNKYR